MKRLYFGTGILAAAILGSVLAQSLDHPLLWMPATIVVGLWIGMTTGYIRGRT